MVRFWGARIGARPIWPSLLGKTLIFRKKLQFFWERKKTLSLLPGREREIPSCLLGVFPTDISTFLFPFFFHEWGRRGKYRERSVNFPLERFFLLPALLSRLPRHGRGHFVKDTVSQIFGKLLAFSRTRLRIPPCKRGRAGGEKSILFLHSTRSFCHIYGKRRRGENYPPFFDLSIFFVGPLTPPFPHITAGKSNAPYVMWTLYRRTTGRLIILSAATRRVPENFFAYFFFSAKAKAGGESAPHIRRKRRKSLN